MVNDNRERAPMAAVFAHVAVQPFPDTLPYGASPSQEIAGDLAELDAETERKLIAISRAEQAA